MINTTINLTIDENNNIKIANIDSSMSFDIKYSDKLVKAIDIYAILQYEIGKKYIVTSNLEEIQDEKIKEYFGDIISLIEGIVEEINNIVLEDVTSKND